MEDICQAITKGWQKEPCKNPAKYGVYCGVHRKCKPDPKNICEGICKSGKKCTNPVKRGQFCHLHIIPEQPEHDWEELKLYNPDINWPSMSSILNLVKKVKNGRQLAEVIDRYTSSYYPTIWFPVTETSPELNEIRDNKFIILMMETFFVNYYLDYSTEHWQNIITDLSKKTENVKWLSEYRMLFRKKFDNTFREETKKNYIEKVLVQGGGTDVAKKIISFL